MGDPTGISTSSQASVTYQEHSQNLLVHHQVIAPVTAGKLDLGPWQAIFYFEFDGRRSKRLIIKVPGLV